MNSVAFSISLSSNLPEHITLITLTLGGYFVREVPAMSEHRRTPVAEEADYLWLKLVHHRPPPVADFYPHMELYAC